MRCRLCDDQIYEGEAVLGSDEHKWCAIIRLALDHCERAMQARRAKGLPTPTSPHFVDPHKAVN